jgi:hypothetical protein
MVSPPATPTQRANFEIGRFGIHWPEIELAGLLLGAKVPNALPPQGNVAGSRNPPRQEDGQLSFLDLTETRLLRARPRSLA